MTPRCTLTLTAALVLLPAIAAAQPTVAPSEQPSPVPATVLVSPSVTPEPAPSPAAAALTMPVIPAAPSTPMPSDVVVDYWSAPVFGTGAVLFAGSYGASAIFAASSAHRGNQDLYIPVVGPWMDLADRSTACAGAVDMRSCNSDTSKALLIADGVFQGVGVLTMIDGLVLPHHHTRVVTTARREWHITPTSVHGASGVAVFGHF